MKTISYTESRKRYAEVLDHVTDNREPVIVTRAGHESVVVMALDDFNSMQETAYLMRSPRNAQRLFESLEEVRSGKTTPHDLIED
ncbi:type II toxin-antitoxin system prevent-host-death family antitoxin [Corynebacterium breve]|uniref:Antitoxin n=1 Tax=Corynebacterium breve TaxID=3049799 RepID=A0ABY8VCR1_9CORY|nr:type II toxin-antitoxin system prevent-host-death family antitoxin [Corynebacterium breve]WIM66892.1 type II toxin-antitoxin system prevent-host-death family antitoxin [Corynebacterium breve]